jgi:hypothetical protein
MSKLTVIEVDRVFVVDSRLIADRLDIDHKSFIKTIRKYQTKVEQRFGCIRFEISNVQMPKGGTREEVSHAGLYHWENVVSYKGWTGKGNRIDLNYPCKLTTGYFGGSLTLLILLCHAKKIQLTIAPCSPTSLKLSFVRASEQATMDKAISFFKDTVEAIANV